MFVTMSSFSSIGDGMVKGWSCTTRSIGGGGGGPEGEEGVSNGVVQFGGVRGEIGGEHDGRTGDGWMGGAHGFDTTGRDCLVSVPAPVGLIKRRGLVFFNLVTRSIGVCLSVTICLCGKTADGQIGGTHGCDATGGTGGGKRRFLIDWDGCGTVNGSTVQLGEPKWNAISRKKKWTEQCKAIKKNLNNEKYQHLFSHIFFHPHQ
jgi:hypothetical protein